MERERHEEPDSGKYEPPAIDDLDTSDGPAVTAAGAPSPVDGTPGAE